MKKPRTIGRSNYNITQNLMKEIESLQNPLIKNIIQLQEKSRNRKKEQLFIIEGKREISLAISGHYTIEKILFCEKVITYEELSEFHSSSIEFIKITSDIYNKLAYRDTTEGVIAIVKTKNHTLNDLVLPKNPLLLVVESIEKPGNLGAMLRTADAAKFDAVIVANPKSDFYNPNVIRSSVGCVFTNQLASGTTEDVIVYMRNNKINIYSAILQEAVPYYSQDYTEATALVVGTEATGLSEQWRVASKQNIIIPMEGVIDSMNVSVAAAILMFEAKRQRRDQKI